MNELVSVLDEYLAKIVHELQAKQTVLDYLQTIFLILAVVVALIIGLLPTFREKKKNETLTKRLRSKINYELARLPSQIFVLKKDIPLGKKINFLFDENREFFNEIMHNLEIYCNDIYLLEEKEADLLTDITNMLRKGKDLGGFLHAKFYNGLLIKTLQLFDLIVMNLRGKEKAEKISIPLFTLSENDETIVYKFHKVGIEDPEIKLKGNIID